MKKSHETKWPSVTVYLCGDKIVKQKMLTSLLRVKLEFLMIFCKTIQVRGLIKVIGAGFIEALHILRHLFAQGYQFPRISKLSSSTTLVKPQKKHSSPYPEMWFSIQLVTVTTKIQSKTTLILKVGLKNKLQPSHPPID